MLCYLVASMSLHIWLPGDGEGRDACRSLSAHRPSSFPQSRSRTKRPNVSARRCGPAGSSASAPLRPQAQRISIGQPWQPRRRPFVEQLRSGRLPPLPGGHGMEMRCQTRRRPCWPARSLVIPPPRWWPQQKPMTPGPAEELPGSPKTVASVTSAVCRSSGNVQMVAVSGAVLLTQEWMVCLYFRIQLPDILRQRFPSLS